MVPVGWLDFVLQTTADPGVGPDELVDFWPLLVRIGWFLAGGLVIGLLGWFVVEPAIGRAIRRRNPDNPTIQEAITRYVRLFVVILAVIVGAGFAGYGQFIGDSAIVIAAATLAIGVAGQTVIGSLFSGLVLVTDPEFNVGNYIEWADGEGVVKSITLRVTRVHEPDGTLVTIPNTTLTNEPVARPFGRDRTRVVERIGLAYEDDVDEALDRLTAAATDLSGVLDDPRPRAYVDDFGSDAVVIRVHYWISDPRRRDVFAIRSAYARAVKTSLEDAGITISPASKRDLEGRVEIDMTDEVA